MAKKILIAQDIAQEGKDLLIQNGYEIKMGTAFDEETLKKEIVDCDAVVVRTAKYTRKVIEAGKNVMIYARAGAGFDNIDLDAANEMGVWVTNAPDSNSSAVAEGAIAMILGTSRRFYYLENEFRKGDYGIRNKCKTHEVAGKTLALIGLGRIGKIVARRAMYGLDMKVIGYDPYIAKENVPEGVELVEDRDEVFRRADFVTLHLPYTGQILIGEHELSLMKSTAYVINLSRGPALDEKALYEALKNHKIAGAGLDVFDPEPPKVDNPLFTLDNIMLTPHVAGVTAEGLVRGGVQAAESIIEALKGEKPSCVVNNPVNPRNMR